MSYFFKNDTSKTTSAPSDKQLSDRELQKGFFDELMRLPNQKQMLKQKGFDFDKTFDENYDDGFRLYETTQSAKADEPIIQTTPVAESAPGAKLFNPSEHVFYPMFEKREKEEPGIFTKAETDKVRERIGADTKEVPEWYILSAKPIHDRIEDSAAKNDTYSITAAQNELGALNQKLDEYNDYPEWAKFYMDSYTNDYIKSAFAKDGIGAARELYNASDEEYANNMETASRLGEILRDRLSFRNELYEFDKTLGSTYDSLMNEMANAQKLYDKATQSGNTKIAKQADSIITSVEKAIGKLDTYYSKAKDTDRASVAWAPYYANKTADELFYAELGSVLAADNKEMFDFAFEQAQTDKKDYEAKLALRKEIEKSAGGAVVEFDRISDDYVKAEKDYYEALENGDTEKTEDALSRMDKAQKEMESFVTSYRNGEFQEPDDESEDKPAKETGKAVVTEHTDYSLTDTRAHLPVSPKFTNDPENRSAEAYQTVLDQFDVENNPRYQKRNGNTYCNIYVSDVLSAMGVTFPFWLSKHGKTPYKYDTSKTYSQNASEAYQLDANGMCNWLANNGFENGWEKVTPTKAQSLANKGCPVVVSWYNKDGIGHIALVVPHKNGTNSKSVAISQAGAKNFAYTSVESGFGNKQVTYYYHE